jgi:hypothetical protein
MAGVGEPERRVVRTEPEKPQPAKPPVKPPQPEQVP